jgi:hypothetical protein
MMFASFNFTDPTVRDSSAEALGTAMKVVGEKQIMVFMTDLDNIKMTKVSIHITSFVAATKVLELRLEHGVQRHTTDITAARSEHFELKVSMDGKLSSHPN